MNTETGARQRALNEFTFGDRIVALPSQFPSCTKDRGLWMGGHAGGTEVSVSGFERIFGGEIVSEYRTAMA